MSPILTVHRIGASKRTSANDRPPADQPNLRREETLGTLAARDYELRMSGRGGLAGLAVAILIAGVCAGLIAWRLTPARLQPPVAGPRRSKPGRRSSGAPNKAFDNHRSAGRSGACAKGRGPGAEGRSHLCPSEIRPAGAANAGESPFRQFDSDLDHRRVHGQVSGSRPRGRRARSAIGDELGANQRGPK